MLGTIKDQYFAIHTHGCDDVWVLWLVAGLVDLTWVINLLLDGHLDASSFAVCVSITSDLLTVLIVLLGIGCGVIW